MTQAALLLVQTLASGSSGNMAVIRSARATLVLDAGLPSGRGTARALAEAGVEVHDVRAVLISHAHTDHLHRASLHWFARAGVPVLAGPETARAAARLCEQNGHDPGCLVPLHAGTTYLVDDIEVTPFTVPHDVPTYGFAFMVRGGTGHRKVAVATDLGCAPDGLIPYFANADAILIEANYNEERLRRSHRHPLDTARVRGDLGHLSNEDAGCFLRRVLAASERPPSAVLLVHLSHDHNDPELAVRDVRSALGRPASATLPLGVAPRRGPGPLIRV